jgi:hypothetical protein
VRYKKLLFYRLFKAFSMHYVHCILKGNWAGNGNFLYHYCSVAIKKQISFTLLIKMTRYTLIIFICIFSFSCKKSINNKDRSYSKLIPDKVLQEAINYLVNDSSINEFRLSKRFVDNDWLNVLDKMIL